MISSPKGRIESYLRSATRGLWGRERSTVREELEAHIQARVAAYCLGGLGEAEAVERTLIELGHPKEVNADMTRLYTLPTQLGAALQGALRQFRSRQLESLLIIVAVALGVGVITAVAAFLGLDSQVESLFRASLESRELSIQTAENDPYAFSGANAPLVQRLGEKDQAPPEFMLDDLEQIQAAAPSVPYAYVRDPRFLATRSSEDTIIFLGVTADFLNAANLELQSGSFFSESDFRERRRVLLVSPETVRRLGLSGDPTGQAVVFDGTPGRPEYTILGVLQGRPGSQGPSDAGYFPYVPSTGLRHLYFAVDDPRLVPDARAELQAFINQTWGEGVTVSSQPGVRRITATQRLTSWAIALFASVGLLVASLNIMNLMLARVFKRSRLIGVMRCLGATRGTIQRQILTEAGLLGVLGGGSGDRCRLWPFVGLRSLLRGGN